MLRLNDFFVAKYTHRVYNYKHFILNVIHFKVTIFFPMNTLTKSAYLHKPVKHKSTIVEAWFCSFNNY